MKFFRTADAFRTRRREGPHILHKHDHGPALASIAALAMAKEIPQSEHGMKEVQAAAHCVTEAAENNGPMRFARIGMMQAINRHKPEEFDPKLKEPH